jgi:uncharacterized protein
MSIGVLTIHLHIPGCSSLKEKRSHIRPILIRLHREFNISAAEIDRMDAWQDAVIACALVSNNKNHTQRVLQKVISYTEKTWPDIYIANEQIELF